MSVWGGTTSTNMESLLTLQQSNKVPNRSSILKQLLLNFPGHRKLSVPGLYIDEVIILVVSSDKPKLGKTTTTRYKQTLKCKEATRIEDTK